MIRFGRLSHTHRHNYEISTISPSSKIKESYYPTLQIIKVSHKPECQSIWIDNKIPETGCLETREIDFSNSGG